MKYEALTRSLAQSQTLIIFEGLAETMKLNPAVAITIDLNCQKFLGLQLVGVAVGSRAYSVRPSDHLIDGLVLQSCGV